MPIGIRSLTVDRNNQKVFVTPTDCDHIFLYEPDWLGREKVQSAWGTWQFTDNYRIVDTAVLDGQLFMFVESESLYIIERVPAARQTL